MGKQVGIIPFTGRVGSLIGYKVGHQYLLRSMPARVRQTPSTRRSAQQFGKASQLGRSLRSALRPQLTVPIDSTLGNRLNKALLHILHQDDLHREKRFIPQYFKDLEGFSLTPFTRLWDLMEVTPVVSRGNGIQVHVPAMRVACRYAAATHVQVRAIALYTDGRRSQSTASEPKMLEARKPSQAFTLTIPDEGAGICCVILEVRPFQQQGKTFFRLSHRKHLAAEVIAVFSPVKPVKEATEYPPERRRHPMLPPAVEGLVFHPPPLE
ncbi:hypothetical protein ACWKWU_10785 [Chitinophaga lutea]